MHTPPAVDWSAIDTVLLDMDGTLLDLRFDTWFWTEVIPQHYAAANGLEHADALAAIMPKFSAVRGTLQWYCVDHWTRELKLDIGALKRAVQSHVKFLPGAEQFLAALRARGKRVVLVTNCHPVALAIKNERVAVTAYFHATYSTHTFGVPKEDGAFWPQLMRQEPFSPARTLFVDDSLAVLDAAREFGIEWLRAVRHPDSGSTAQDTGRYHAVDGVAELL